MMNPKLLLGLTSAFFFTSLKPNSVISISIQRDFNEEQLARKDLITEQDKKSLISEKKDHLKENKLKFFEQLTRGNSNKILKIMDPDVTSTPLTNKQYFYKSRLSKRDMSNYNAYNDSSNANEHFKSDKKENYGEIRAASIPFLSKDGESQSTSSSGLPSVPGISQISGLSNLMPNSSTAGSNVPTAILGGFSILIIPMPGLSMSNIGSTLQTGQQMSQMIPGMPSLPISR